MLTIMVFEKHHVPTTIIYRREDAIQCGGYDSMIRKWQDWAFGVSLLDYRMSKELGTDICFWEGVSYYYRAHEHQGRISRSNIDELSQTRYVVDAHIHSFRK